MTENDSPSTPTSRPRITSAQWTLIIVIVALTLVGVLYRIFVMHKLEQTAALFIGLPAVLAIAITLTPHAKSATGMIMKAMTIALLMSGPILGEGFICILMAAPLFYLVGAIIGLVVDRKGNKEKGVTTSVIVLFPFLLASLEGTTPSLSFPREQQITVTKIVNGTPAEVERALGRQPVFDAALPPFLQLKFPRPVATSGEGLTVGSERRIHFAGGEGHPGDLLLRITDREPSSVTFTAQSDTSKIAHWMTWRASHVAWRAAGENRTEVTWTIAYDRELDPAWYFAPWERYATRLAASYLIDSLAAPR
jgi:hypothetical protein